MDRIEELSKKLIELGSSSGYCTSDYIRCLANIKYFTVDRYKLDYSNIKIFFMLGLEKAYGCIGENISKEVDNALDLMFVGDFKGFCLMSAIIASLEKSKEDKTE